MEFIRNVEKDIDQNTLVGSELTEMKEELQGGPLHVLMYAPIRYKKITIDKAKDELIICKNNVHFCHSLLSYIDQSANNIDEFTCFIDDISSSDFYIKEKSKRQEMGFTNNQEINNLIVLKWLNELGIIDRYEYEKNSIGSISLTRSLGNVRTIKEIIPKDRITTINKILENQLNNINSLENRLEQKDNNGGDINQPIKIISSKKMDFLEEYQRGEKVLKVLHSELKPNEIENSKSFVDAINTIPEGDSIMIMDHNGSKYFGLEESEFINLIVEKKPNKVYLGTCYGISLGKKINDLLPDCRIYSTEDNEKWHGFNPGKKGIDGIFPGGFVEH